MKSTKEIIKKILLEQTPSEAEEYSPPEGPHNDYYDVGLALRRIVLNKNTGEWIDTDYLEEESIQTSWDLKDAEQMYQRKLFELNFFDTKGKIREQREYTDDHYEYRQTSITRRRLESIIRAEIREQMRRGRQLNNPHLNEDIVRVAQRILHQMEENLSYFGENYEGELDDLFNGTVD